MTLLLPYNSSDAHFPLFEAIANSPVFQNLNSELGSNRQDPLLCQIPVKNDHQAIQYWLREYDQKPTTYRCYQKESERLLLWAMYQRQKPISGFNREDFEAYFSFLSDPKPRERWCSSDGPRGSRHCTRGSSHWRPFVGPLSTSAKQTAITIINSMMDYWVQARYICFNPISLMKKKNRQNVNSEQLRIRVWERILEPDEWQMLWETLLQLPEDSQESLLEKERLRFLVLILYFLGLRIHELANHHWGAFCKIRSSWWFFVKGKGDKLGKIPVNDQLLAAVMRFREHLHLSPLPQSGELGPILPSFRTKRGLGVRHMNKLLKDLALKAATRWEASTQPEKADKMKRFSAHWLRHLSATMQDQAGILFKHIQANHRHESEETTRRYVHAIDQDRHQDMQKLKLPSEL